MITFPVPGSQRQGRYHMDPKGSVTVFFSLIITVVFSLILTSVMAVKIQAGRMTLANSADQALFSLFSEYDRDLADRYGLFFLDMGMDTGAMCPGECIDFLDECAARILDPSEGTFIRRGRNILNISAKTTSIDAYRLLFESGGAAAASQIVDYMKDTSAISLISALSGSLTHNSAVTNNMENAGHNINMNVINDAFASSGSEGAGEGSGEDGTGPAADPESIKKTFRFIDTAGKINIWRHRSLIDLVVKDPGSISGKVFDISQAARCAPHPESLGVISFKNDPDTFMNLLLINEYILSHTGNYTHPSEDTSLTYQLEYVISGRPCDRDCLSYVINRLMLIRLGTNFVSINSDSALKAEVSALAAVMAAVFMIPELEPVFEAAVAAAWSWGESIIDIRTLLSGGRIPLLKNSSNIRVTLDDLASVFTGADSLCISDPSGLSYTDYMRIFLNAKSRNETFPRFLDTVQDTVRTSCGRPAFRLDMCADEMEITLGADIENIKTFYTTRKYSYCPAG